MICSSRSAVWPICQYEPHEVIIPSINPARVLVQKLWAKKRSCNDLNLPPDILEAWFIWERKLPDLVHITLPLTALTGAQLSSLKTQYQGHKRTPTQLKAHRIFAKLREKRHRALSEDLHSVQEVERKASGSSDDWLTSCLSIVCEGSILFDWTAFDRILSLLGNTVRNATAASLLAMRWFIAHRRTHLKFTEIRTQTSRCREHMEP